MKLIFLHGPPASGKYTIATELQARYGVLNFHNHLTIEVAKSLFDFGTAEFWDLTHRLRRLALDCYSSPHDDANVAALEHEITSRGGSSCRSSSSAVSRS